MAGKQQAEAAQEAATETTAAPVSSMVPVYERLIRAGVRTLEQVPEHLREDVQRLLNAGV